MGSRIRPRTFSHVGIVVRSVEEFRRTWGELLGATEWLQRDVPQPAGRVQLSGERIEGPGANRIAYTRVAGLPVELIEPLEGDTSAARWLRERGPGIQHLGFWVDDLAAQVAALGGDVSVTYSPASLVPELAARPVVATGTTGAEPDERPPFWVYLGSAAPGQQGWQLELMDAAFEHVYRESYGDFAYYPGDLPL